jgi:raffinose/stachyose/melibiose transport system substrate-binding protein
MSSNSDENFKMRVINDFLTGSEPDVLFFFSGADANSFIEAGRVVSLGEIREEYPDYISNLDITRIPPSMVDGKIEAIPVSGYWEAMFVNTTVLEAAGVEVPGADYTWEQFLEDCEKIKEAGFTPIAAALGNIPHYWWEYAIFNHTPPKMHQAIPESVDDAMGEAWVAGISDIVDLYQRGYFPKYTNSVTDENTFSLFMEGKAAFLIDGSWKVGSIVQNCQEIANDESTLDEEKLAQFTVTFVPGTRSRQATDLIGGTSMGYYISRKAWNDPDKRDAAVSFISYMTSDEVVPKFAKHAANILKDAPTASVEELNSLQKHAVDTLAESTSLTPAVQDIFQGECRVTTFDEMPDIVNGRVSPYDAVRKGLEIYREQGEE